MAEYRLQFTADTSSANRSINSLQKAVQAVTREFEKAEISSEEFLSAASDLSRLKKELNDARAAVVNIDKAYRDLNKAIESNFSVYQQVGKAAESYHRKLIQLAEDSFKQEDELRDKNYRAELADFDRRLNAAVSARRKIDAQQRGIMEFRAGMGGRGAIPSVASPIGGGEAFPGSPGYFHPSSLAAYEKKLEDLRNKARLIAPDTNQWKQVNREILRTEKSVDRLQKMQTGGPSTRSRIGAASGAFLYGGGLGGGIFSALGGVLGGLGGGVPGAFGGAAVGQIADNLSQSLSGITTQAAEVQKLQRGLALASIDAKDFANAQAAVFDSSQRLLMPLEQAVRYYTQLRVNTKQFGLSVKDTQQIFEGTALAVMATGGSLDDLDGAMRAVVQVMSKGKLSAEELRGQLGERLPGAVVKFAAVNKLTLQELDKLLEEGALGVGEFIKYLKGSEKEFSNFREVMQTAPEFAGRRLQQSFEELTREIGSLFGGVGASIQDTLTAAIKGITQFIQENRAYLRQFISDWQSIVGPIVKIFGQLLGVVAKFAIEAGKVFQQLFSTIRQSVGLANIGEAKARFDRAKAAVAGKQRPKGNVRGGGPFQEYDQAKAAFEALGGEAAFKKASAPITPPNLTFGGPGAGMSIDRQAEADDKAREKALREQSQLNSLIQEGLKTRTELGLVGKDELSQIEGRVQLAKEILALELKNIRATVTGAIRQQMINNAIAEYQLFVAKSNEEWADTLKELDKIKLRAEEIRNKIFGQEDTGRSPLQKVFADIEQEGIDAIQALDKELEGLNERYGTRPEGGAQRALLGNLKESILGRTPEQKTLQASQRFTKDTIADLKTRIREAQTFGQNMTTLDEIIVKLGDDWGRLSPEIRSEITSLASQIDQLAPFQKWAEGARQLRQEMQELVSLNNITMGGARAIGDAFGTAFKDVISGATSAQQALSNMMQSIASYFLDMAAKIIAQQITMIVYGTIMKALGIGVSLGGGGGFSFGGKSGGFDLPGFQMPSYMAGANGGIAKGGWEPFPVTPFANGGIVNGPTLGLVGEGKYNEAIVPLPDGRSIPVMMKGSQPSSRELLSSNSSSIASSPVLNMSFESTVINGVEYVSRDQLEAAMMETRKLAARDGANRGAALAIDRLQHSPNTRRRIGMR